MDISSIVMIVVTILKGFFIMLIAYNGLTILTKWIFSFRRTQIIESKEISGLSMALALLFILCTLY